MLVVVYRRFGTAYRSHFQGQSSQDAIDRLSRNVSKSYEHSLRNIPEQGFIEEFSSLNFSTLENGSAHCLKHSESTHPVRRHHIPEERRPQPYRYESPETRKLIVARPLSSSGATVETEGSLSGSS
jgi:hypothetical protein